VTEVRSFHQLQVLFVLSRSAGGNFIDPFAAMTMIGTAKSGEGVEELVVSSDAGRGNEATHGERIDERVVEMLIFKSLRGGNFAIAAGGLRTIAVRGGFQFDEGMSGNVDAETIFRAGTNPGFGVDRAAEVDVEVRAFGHFLE